MKSHSSNKTPCRFRRRWLVVLIAALALAIILGSFIAENWQYALLILRIAVVTIFVAAIGHARDDAYDITEET